MSDSVFIAPSLSTAQTEDTFEFQSYEKKEHSRPYLGPDVKPENLVELVSSYYNVPELIRYFKEHPQYKKITLQFPDELVLDSSIVVQLMQQELTGEDEDGSECASGPCSDTVVEDGKKCGNSDGCGCSAGSAERETGRKVWILADTSYSSCCVDEVASEHVKGDIVVHFGDACMNAVQKLPVVYCFGKPMLDLDLVISQFESKFTDKNEKVCLLADAPCSSHMRTLYNKLHDDEGFHNVVFGDINQGMLEADTHIVGYSNSSEHDESLQKYMTFGNRNIFGSPDQKRSQEEDSSELQEYQLFHITVPKDPHLLYLTTKFQSVTLYDTGNNTIIEGPFPSMMKRYKFMHMARTAGTVGILVNTLSLRNTKETMNQLTKLLKENGKKHYLFVVGKPNVAKLANFEPIEIWCILGCGQGGIVLDQYNEFYKPIITPYELLMALSDEVTWTGQWITDFQTIIKQIEDEVHDVDEVCSVHSDSSSTSFIEDEAPEFSAVTGKYVSTSRPLRQIARLEIETPLEQVQASDSTELVKQFAKTVSIRNTVSTSAAFLQTRQWTGLGSDYNKEDEGEQDGATVEEGTAGVARSYQFDENNKA
ncbi:unnamed protein product [Kluyveromyces dobzhanskii CBS 2104]|uniref:2-(3-amino-3-carboxypropyl)histidine synthase subunit 2 n=1 Tax=Kluyveromyces dobzhanskii CBS 2104 TaxID=1427455 RepID=A0A0A8L384_9SACH|nr:unnamed protein product [Kluyveromyces dobzhanskii CBS 2104]